MLIYHQWCLGRDLGPPVINFFSKKKYVSRTSGNVLNGILALSDRQTDPSGTHLGPFSFLGFFFNLGGIIGRPKPSRSTDFCQATQDPKSGPCIHKTHPSLRFFFQNVRKCFKWHFNFIRSSNGAIWSPFWHFYIFFLFNRHNRTSFYPEPSPA